MNKEEITRKSIFMTGFRSKLTYPFSFEDLEEVGGIIDFYEEKVNQLEEDEDITKWGKGALEEIQTKKDYKIKDILEKHEGKPTAKAMVVLCILLVIGILLRWDATIEGIKRGFGFFGID